MKGQITIAEYLEERNKPHPVNIMGICDDAYCPECNYCIDELKHLDCEYCPWCGVRIDWAPWHRVNDEDIGNEQTLD